METPEVRGDWKTISEADIRTKCLQVNVTSGAGKLELIPIDELVGKQNAGQRYIIKLMLSHSSAIFHVYLQEFSGYDLFFCIGTHTCPLTFQYVTFPIEEQKAVLDK